VARRRKKLRLWHLELAAISMLGFLVYLYLTGGPPSSPQRRKFETGALKSYEQSSSPSATRLACSAWQSGTQTPFQQA
jgi:hypothetical protein